MNKFLRTLLGLLVLVAMATGTAQAQTQIAHTTFSAAVTDTATSVTLTAASGAVKGYFLYVDGEEMALQTNTTGNTWTVRRGVAGGLVKSRPHSTTAIVWVVPGDGLKAYDVSGTCTATLLQYTPHINAQANHIFDCSGAGVWMQRSLDRTNVQAGQLLCNGQVRCRDEFNNGYVVFKNDGTARSKGDGDIEEVFGGPFVVNEYKETGAKTTSSWLELGGQLDIRGDKTDAAEGVEIVFNTSSDAALNSVLTAGTTGGCVSAMFEVASVAHITELNLGWRQNQAYQAGASNYTSYTLYNTVGLTTTNGIITSSAPSHTDTTGTATWADGERRALKVCLSSAGVPTAYYSDAVADFEQPIFHPITMTTTGTTVTATTGMIPFLSFIAVGTVDSGTKVDWVELSNTP